jgi:hypothetical protein
MDRRRWPKPASRRAGPAITTDAPQRTSSSAAALPRLVPPPVTSPTRPASTSGAKTFDAASAYSPSTLITRRLDRPPSNSQ